MIAPLPQTGQAPQTTHSTIVSVAVELIGITAIVLVAGISDNAGKAMVVLMVAFALGWALYHSGLLQSLAGKA
jgi:hypothetical protein